MPDLESPLSGHFYCSPEVKEGTRGWREVVALGDAIYEWGLISVYWSPQNRRYFWHADTGCLCNGWGENLTSMADFNDGDRNAVRSALRGFAQEHPYYASESQLAEALNTLANFKEDQ